MAHGDLAWLFHESHTGLVDCLNMLLSCFRKRRSVGVMGTDGFDFIIRRFSRLTAKNGQ